MTTFILKKYSDKESVPKTDEEKKELMEQEKQGAVQAKEEESIQIEVSGSISSIVAAALQKVLGNKNIQLDVVEDTNEEQADSTIKAISSEDINNDPLKTFRSINDSDVVFISTEGFTTSQEEWFLTNLPNKTSKVFYSVEGLADFLVQQAGENLEKTEGDLTDTDKKKKGNK